METITKNDLAKKLAHKHGISKTLAYKIVGDLFELLVKFVKDNCRIGIRNFGVFKPKHTRAREGRNPQDGTPITIQAKSTIKFKPSKTL